MGINHGGHEPDKHDIMNYFWIPNLMFITLLPFVTGLNGFYIIGITLV